jgi:hypothetical protein
MILLCLAQLPLFGAGLWLGVQASLITAAVGFMMLLAGGKLLIATTFAGLNAIPVVLLVRQALLGREGTGDGIAWYPPGLLAAWLTGLGLAVAAVVVSVLGGVEGIRAALREALAPALDSGFDLSAAGSDELLNSAAFVLPGLIAASWMAMTVSNGILAQGLLARFGANWRPSPDIAALRLPIWIPRTARIFRRSNASWWRGPFRRAQRHDRAGCFVLPCGVGSAAHFGAPARAPGAPPLYLLRAGWGIRLAAAADYCLGSARIAFGLRRRFAQS